MKKLKLKALQLGATEMLTREQLINVLGGDGSGNGSDPSLLCFSSSTACTWTDANGSTSNGHCDWELVSSGGSLPIPICYCNTPLHPHYSESSSPSKCNRL